MSPGAVAQLGERCNRTAEVEGSTPFRSTFHSQFLVPLPVLITGRSLDPVRGYGHNRPRPYGTFHVGRALDDRSIRRRGTHRRASSGCHLRTSPWTVGGCAVRGWSGPRLVDS